MNFCVFHILKTQKLQFTKVQQKSKKVLLLCFVAFVTYVFYAHRLNQTLLSKKMISKISKLKIIEICQRNAFSIKNGMFWIYCIANLNFLGIPGKEDVAEIWFRLWFCIQARASLWLLDVRAGPSRLEIPGKFPTLKSTYFFTTVLSRLTHKANTQPDLQLILFGYIQPIVPKVFYAWISFLWSIVWLYSTEVSNNCID